MQLRIRGCQVRGKPLYLHSMDLRIWRPLSRRGFLGERHWAVATTSKAYRYGMVRNYYPACKTLDLLHSCMVRGWTRRAVAILILHPLPFFFLFIQIVPSCIGLGSIQQAEKKLQNHFPPTSDQSKPGIHFQDWCLSLWLTAPAPVKSCRHLGLISVLRTAFPPELCEHSWFLLSFFILTALLEPKLH